jgi:hypothetical protein
MVYILIYYNTFASVFVCTIVCVTLQYTRRRVNIKTEIAVCTVCIQRANWNAGKLDMYSTIDYKKSVFVWMNHNMKCME